MTAILLVVLALCALGFVSLVHRAPELEHRLRELRSRAQARFARLAPRQPGLDEGDHESANQEAWERGVQASAEPEDAGLDESANQEAWECGVQEIAEPPEDADRELEASFEFADEQRSNVEDEVVDAIFAEVADEVADEPAQDAVANDELVDARFETASKRGQVVDAIFDEDVAESVTEREVSGVNDAAEEASEGAEASRVDEILREDEVSAAEVSDGAEASRVDEVTTAEREVSGVNDAAAEASEGSCADEGVRASAEGVSEAVEAEGVRAIAAAHDADASEVEVEASRANETPSEGEGSPADEAVLAIAEGANEVEGDEGVRVIAAAHADASEVEGDEGVRAIAAAHADASEVEAEASRAGETSREREGSRVDEAVREHEAAVAREHEASAAEGVDAEVSSPDDPAAEVSEGDELETSREHEGTDAEGAQGLEYEASHAETPRVHEASAAEGASEARGVVPLTEEPSEVANAKNDATSGMLDGLPLFTGQSPPQVGYDYRPLWASILRGVPDMGQFLTSRYHRMLSPGAASGVATRGDLCHVIDQHGPVMLGALLRVHSRGYDELVLAPYITGGSMHLFRIEQVDEADGGLEASLYGQVGADFVRVLDCLYMPNRGSYELASTTVLELAGLVCELDLAGPAEVALAQDVSGSPALTDFCGRVTEAVELAFYGIPLVRYVIELASDGFNQRAEFEADIRATLPRDKAGQPSAIRRRLTLIAHPLAGPREIRVDDRIRGRAWLLGYRPQVFSEVCETGKLVAAGGAQEAWTHAEVLCTAHQVALCDCPAYSPYLLKQLCAVVDRYPDFPGIVGLLARALGELRMYSEDQTTGSALQRHVEILKRLQRAYPNLSILEVAIRLAKGAGSAGNFVREIPEPGDPSLWVR